MHEVKNWTECSFVTLTYDDEHLPGKGSLSVSDCQKFIKRLRKRLGRKFKYFLGAEYGDMGHRPHYHTILFGVSISERLEVNQAWGLGFVHSGVVTHDSACYVASYTLKKLSGDKRDVYTRLGIVPEFALMSRSPGIGALYVEQNSKFLKQNAFCIVKGSKVALPRYYADKVFTDEEKNLLHSMRQEFYDERMEKLKVQSGSEHGYQVNDYERGMRKQLAADLKARVGLKRRKL